MKSLSILAASLLLPALACLAQSPTPAAPPIPVATPAASATPTSAASPKPTATPSVAAAQKPTPALPNFTKEEQAAGVQRYYPSDIQLGTPKPGENRVVFMGDSITDGWRLPTFFPGKNYINRGASGQTTTQMLVRFPYDVIGTHAAVVTILAGTNDIAQNQGPITLEAIAGNLEKMALIARQHGIHPIICSILPAYDYPWHKGLQPAEKVRTVNRMLKTWCTRKHVIYVDYYPALGDDRGGMQAKYSGDGIHPNAAGYAVMAPLVEAGIHRALRRH
jgi:lysophospholipase L1-like esterase